MYYYGLTTCQLLKLAPPIAAVFVQKQLNCDFNSYFYECFLLLLILLTLPYFSPFKVC